MTAYTLAANATLRDIGNAAIWGKVDARTGGDTVNTNGFDLLIDQDSRYGFSGTSSTTWGALSISSTKGGNVNIDGRFSLLIPYTSGVGTIVPGDLITVAGATGYVVGLYSAALTVWPSLSLTSGWIKIAAWNTVAFPTSGRYTQAGFTFTINGAAKTGFIEINGDEAAAPLVYRLGSFNVRGAWYDLGTTSGVANQTFQIPTNGTTRHIAGVFVEKTAGQEDYEFWPNAGTAMTVGTDEYRGRVCWVSTAGLVRLGHNGTAVSGHTPTAGRKVVIGNVFMENNTTANRAANATPNTNQNTRYRFSTGGGGALTFDKCNMAWYLLCATPYSLSLTDCGVLEYMNITNPGTPMVWSRVGVGSSPVVAATTSSPIAFNDCLTGGSFTDCVWSRATAAGGSFILNLSSCDNFTLLRNRFTANTVRSASTVASLSHTGSGLTMQDCDVVQGKLVFGASHDFVVKNLSYTDCVSGTTDTTYSTYIATFVSLRGGLFEGLNFPIANCHPYTALFLISTSVDGLRIRNIGTRAAPLSMGTLSPCQYLYSSLAGGFKIQRCYVTGLSHANAPGLVYSGGYPFTEENLGNNYVGSHAPNTPERVGRGLGYGPSTSAYTSIYGTHWSDHFLSTTTGLLALYMNEASANTPDQASLSGVTTGCGFTGAGSLSMPAIGNTAVFTMPYYALGHLGFSGLAEMSHADTAFNFRYQLDRNNGSGFSAWSPSYTLANLGPALAAETGFDAAKGLKLRLEVTTVAVNIVSFTRIFIHTVSSDAVQDYQYPLDTFKMTFAGLPIGCDVVVLAAGANVVLDSVDQIAGNSYDYVYEAAHAVDVGFIKAGYVPLYIRGLVLGSADASIPVAMSVDRNYL